MLDKIDMALRYNQRNPKFLGLGDEAMRQYKELLAYVRFLEEFIQMHSDYLDVHKVIDKCPEWLVEAVKQHAAVSVAQTSEKD